MQFTNCPAANQFINPPYGAGWTLWRAIGISL